MNNIEKCKDDFSKIKGKTIALVYIFQGDDSSGFSHFFIWKSNVLTKWMLAIEELHCLPLIIDVRTFVDKAINNTLPHIDYVLNMNSGTNDLSSMALVPSICSSIAVPCIPCNAVTIVTGESKSLSNHIAKALGLNVPSVLENDNPNGIFRPINLGNSMGVKRGTPKSTNNGIYQQFIPGYDITTPIAYNFITCKMELLPTVMYIPNVQDVNWFNGEDTKITRQGYSFKIVNLSPEIQKKYLSLVNELSINTFCRIDARVKCFDNAYHNSSNNEVAFNDTYFVEINVMPTIRDNNNFVYSFESIPKGSTFYECIQVQKNLFGTISLNSFLLAGSMLANSKTKC